MTVKSMNINNVLLFSIGPLGSAVLSLITLPIATWFFLPEDIGRLAMLQVIMSFSVLMCGLGLDQAYVREFYEVEENKRASLLKTVSLPGLFIIVGLLAGSFISPWSISKMLFGVNAGSLTFFLLIAIFCAFNIRFLSLVLRMNERGLAFSISQILPKVVFLLFLGVYILFEFESTFKLLVIAQTISVLCVFLLFSFNARRQLCLALRADFDYKKLKMILVYSIPLMGGGVSFWGLTATDKFFLRAFSSFEELGVYSVSMSFAGVGLILQAIFSTIWAPTVYKWSAEKCSTNKVKKVIDSMVVIVVLLWAGVGVFSWMVPLFLPQSFQSVQSILLVAIAYPLLYTLSEATSVGIGVKRKSVYSLIATVVALVVNVIGNYFLVPRHGAAGAGVASALAFFVFFVVKTEVSVRIWLEFERFKMYLFIVLLLVLSVLINILFFSSKEVVIVFLVFFVAAICSYKRQLLVFCSLLKDNMPSALKGRRDG
ncbi:oligosaccharide flippase family protein [Dasania sp. GY-MA-18]|uniref:Oligosaccharide flippase family protein n=1 Tax=Dasania phycosphaerae TaxID=2950436 RepID=A0A9J6RJB0_9GAMM|nr:MULTISPECIES: oligosaccharide flippase family protein [Dasania]MCR8922127.1 oligosaccharide flippase family protein [Dasania sp. GY-MA-18]MCZ0864555.1 oligosaccharide flippase family protein [Dasania phycosphaerae]MCZ0868283.1 oligosaccharide flippase family protein [Dasania phycosphaerae]